MSRIDTALIQLLSRDNRYIRVPVVCPPLAVAGCAKLACGVTLGGGFAFIPAGYTDPLESLRNELASARSMLQVPNLSDVLPIGVGYLCWKLEEPGYPGPAMLDLALENSVQAIWFSFGNEIGRWIEYVRRYEYPLGSQKADRKHTPVIFVLVNSVEEALVAVNEWKVDVLVAQGIESGGHGGGYAPPTLSLVSSILAALPYQSMSSVPVLAAGGLWNGSQLAALITLGASGAVYGTRFLMTPESLYTPAQKKALVEANSTSNATIRTVAFDVARNTVGWPQGVNGRGLRNKISQQYEEKEGADISELKIRLKKGVEDGNPDYMVTWAGLGVGDMTEIRGAKDVVGSLHHEALQRLKAARDVVIE